MYILYMIYVKPCFGTAEVYHLTWGKRNDIKSQWKTEVLVILTLSLLSGLIIYILQVVAHTQTWKTGLAVQKESGRSSYPFQP